MKPVVRRPISTHQGSGFNPRQSFAKSASDCGSVFSKHQQRQDTYRRSLEDGNMRLEKKLETTARERRALRRAETSIDANADGDASDERSKRQLNERGRSLESRIDHLQHKISESKLDVKPKL